MTVEKDREKNERQIEDLRKNLTSALRAKDSKGVIENFAEKSVMFLLAPPLQFKTGENAPGINGIEEWFETFEGEIGYEVKDFAVTAGETTAFCYSLNRITGCRKNGEKTDIWIRETLGLRKIGGVWKITHQHQSVPFYMDDSAKAAIDLEP
ncbi:MAG: nuclear transport factor 2 family protein [Pyrinomonadaceae bacterium]|nr:nuclear transport factor 2 family protein [Pyrinomonadaceae bacterium]